MGMLSESRESAAATQETKQVTAEHSLFDRMNVSLFRGNRSLLAAAELQAA